MSHPVSTPLDPNLRCKVLVCDTETTGLTHMYHEPWQVAGTLVHRMKDGSERVVDQFEVFMRPDYPERVSPDLIAEGKIKPGQFEDPKYVSQAEGAKQFLDWLNRHVDRYNTRDKILMAGHNVGFDYQFIRNWWELSGLQYFGSYFYWPVLDTRTLLGLNIYAGEEFIPPHCKLADLCGYYQVPFEVEKAHDAVYDLTATHTVIKKLIRRTADLVIKAYEALKARTAAAKAEVKQ